MSRRLLQIVHVLILALLQVLARAEEHSRRCVVDTWNDRKAIGRDIELSLNVFGIEDVYEPGAVYTVTLQTVEEDKVFRYWWLWARAESPADANAMGGLLTPADDELEIDIECSNTLKNAEGTLLTLIKGSWTAPAEGCVRVGGAVSLVESGVPDATVVSRMVCPRAVSALTPHAQCCACDEAKYEMTFEGLWSRNTHPKDFPADESVTKFGDVIGASHSTQYRFWEFGKPASEGLQEVAEEGVTIILEKELKDQSENIRTIIKARGMKYPNMNGKTFAVFRADNQHHLISLVSQLSPSPDWLVGVSGLDLCLRNCSWEQARVVDLYAFDAGTDSGVSYLSPNESTSPPEPVHPLHPGSVTDPRSPFSDSSGTGDTLKPLARLYLTRQRIYEKSCDIKPTSVTENTYSRTQTESGPCDVYAWGLWGACSVTCGTGVKLRQRSYIAPTRAKAFACRVDLTQRQSCRGFRQHCWLPSHYDGDTASSVGPCAVTSWGRWGACSATCGRGVRVRERSYRVRAPDMYKKCHLGYRQRPKMQQTVPCYEKHVNCTQETDSTITRQHNSSSSDCAMTPWAAWSRCDVGCRPSRRMRTRILLTHRTEQDGMLALLDKEWQRLYNALRVGNHSAEFQLYLPEGEIEDEAMSSARRHLQRCRHEPVTQTTWCPRDKNCDHNVERARDVCSLDYDVGHCRMYKERWFFDASRSTCEPFGYGGCGGNMNNFATYRECRQVCDPYRDELLRDRGPHSNATEKYTANGEKEVSNISGFKYSTPASAVTATRPDPRNPHGCIVSEWTEWSACSESCGFSALKSRARTVSPPQMTQYDRTGPHVPVKCPSRLQVQICSRLPPCPPAGT